MGESVQLCAPAAPGGGPTGETSASFAASERTSAGVIRPPALVPRGEYYPVPWSTCIFA
jgi:hypothetical protein